VRGIAERAYFECCRTFGRLLRSTRYATVRVVDRGGVREVHKRRLAHAPLLIRLGEPLVALLDTGVRVLRQGEWEKRERSMYRTLYDSAVHVRADGGLVLPCLPGATLAGLLEDGTLDARVRSRAIGLAVGALAELHGRGLTHGDAMAENVMVDLDAGVARWFDFETTHDPLCTMEWRRADDVRALLATTLLRTSRVALAPTLDLVLDVYGDEDVARRVGVSFGSALRRPLAFHLGQAPLSLGCYREVARRVRERAALRSAAP
jgi:hypothetical protein